MDLLLIRHAPAEDRDAFARTGRPDRERPLTDRGREKMERAAHGLATVVPQLDLLATSPFTRAAETAGIVARRYDGLTPEPLDTLASGGQPPNLLPWLRKRRRANTVAIVGHAPDLDELAAWLLTGQPDPLFQLRKGGACLLRFSAAPDPGAAHLSWLMTPRLLRALGG